MRYMVCLDGGCPEPLEQLPETNLFYGSDFALRTATVLKEKCPDSVVSIVLVDDDA